MLANPPPGDWLTWRRTHDGLGFSTLTQIDKNNVADLQLAWSLALPPGPNTATPLVHDGVIYVHSFGDHVQALDAKTGDELWHYARDVAEHGTADGQAQHGALRGQDLLRHVRRACRGARCADRRGRVGQCRSRSPAAALA